MLKVTLKQELNRVKPRLKFNCRQEKGEMEDCIIIKLLELCLGYTKYSRRQGVWINLSM